jgi:hypothetical protein
MPQALRLFGHEQGRDRNRTLRVAKELKGDIGHNPRAIARHLVSATRSPVLDTTKRRERRLYYLVARPPIPVSDEAYATRVAFIIEEGGSAMNVSGNRGDGGIGGGCVHEVHAPM